MTQGITPRVVDWLLYNRRDLRALVDALEPRGSSGVVQIAVRTRSHRSGSHRSEVEHVAISRAAISTVLDAVDRALARLPKALRRLVRLRYDENMSIQQIARYVHWSERSCYRKLEIIRARLASSLSLVDDLNMADFWQEIGRILAG